MVFFSLLGVEASRSSFTSSGDHAKVFSLGQLFRSRWTASSLLIDRLSSYLYSSRLGTACWLASHPAERVTGVRIISNHKFSKHDGHNNWSENWTVCLQYQCFLSISIPAFNISGHGHESLLNISSTFCTSFHEGNSNFIGKCLKRSKSNRLMKIWRFA